MNNVCLRVENLRKTYANKEALKDISFHVKTGEIVALLGPNGAGKSTTMKIILDLRKADAGLIHRPAKDEVGYAAQDISFPLNLRTLEVLNLIKSHFHKGPSTQTLIERFELSGFLHRQIGGLSGGEKRRLAMACALLGDPQLLILDEPTTGLDVESRIKLWQEIRYFASQGGGVLLSTHDLNEVAQIAHRVIIIDHGRVLFDGTVADITRHLDIKTVRLQSNVHPTSQHILHIQSEGAQHCILTHSAEELLRDILPKYDCIKYLEVSAASLEEAFIHLRKTHNEKI